MRFFALFMTFLLATPALGFPARNHTKDTAGPQGRLRAQTTSLRKVQTDRDARSARAAQRRALNKAVAPVLVTHLTEVVLRNPVVTDTMETLDALVAARPVFKGMILGYPLHAPEYGRTVLVLMRDPKTGEPTILAGDKAGKQDFRQLSPPGDDRPGIVIPPTVRLTRLRPLEARDLVSMMEDHFQDHPLDHAFLDELVLKTVAERVAKSAIRAVTRLDLVGER